MGLTIVGVSSLIIEMYMGNYMDPCNAVGSILVGGDFFTHDECYELLSAA